MNKLPFRFPELTEALGRDYSYTQFPDFTNHKPASSSGKASPLTQLLNAIHAATRKLTYASTSLTTWDEALVFSNDAISRSLSNKAYRLNRSQQNHWRAGLPINYSKQVSHDWFNNHLVPRLLNGTIRHSTAVLGEPGCGKSTILKYLLSKNFNNCQSNEIVFSRFEFLKYWSQWRTTGNDRNDLSNYLSYIHLRDLILSEYCDLPNGDHFCLKDKYQGTPKSVSHDGVIPITRRTTAMPAESLNDSIEATLEHATQILSELGIRTNKISLAAMRSVLECCKESNKAVMAAIRALPYRQRLALIVALSKDKLVVTIFDGLDSLNIEDALYPTPQLSVVNDIYLNRSAILSYDDLAKIGINLRCDSVIVMRNNTLAILSNNAQVADNAIAPLEPFTVAQIDPLAAIYGAAQRTALELDPRIAGSTQRKSDTVTLLMTIIKRVLIAIGRANGAHVSIQAVYGLFDGNIRELFGFLEHVIRWQATEMSNDRSFRTSTHSTDAQQLLRILASADGTSFLRQKAYRIIELLLFTDTDYFENAIRAESEITFEASGQIRLQKNSGHKGRVDNVYSYLLLHEPESKDEHSLLEKIRVLQVAAMEPVSLKGLNIKLLEIFGYKCMNLKDVVGLLLKTNFLTADIRRSPAGNEPFFRTTNRGRLCVKSLIFNLTYIEHIYHKTLLPGPMTFPLKDRPRSEDIRAWTVASIRNAYIFLTYVKFVEGNRANGHSVPQKFRVLPSMEASVLDAVKRITLGEAGSDIAAAAMDEIKAISALWAKRRLVS
jgi:hypothetical protein